MSHHKYHLLIVIFRLDMLTLGSSRPALMQMLWRAPKSKVAVANAGKTMNGASVEANRVPRIGQWKGAVQ
jgi:hypothetical protein